MHKHAEKMGFQSTYEELKRVLVRTDFGTLSSFQSTYEELKRGKGSLVGLGLWKFSEYLRGIETAQIGFEPKGVA